MWGEGFWHIFGRLKQTKTNRRRSEIREVRSAKGHTDIGYVNYLPEVEVLFVITEAKQKKRALKGNLDYHAI